MPKKETPTPLKKKEKKIISRPPFDRFPPNLNFEKKAFDFFEKNLFFLKNFSKKAPYGKPSQPPPYRI